MFFENHREQQYAINDKKIKEAQIRLASVNQQLAELLSEYGLNLETLRVELNNPSNFTAEEWEILVELQREEAECHERNKAAPNPQETQKKYSERAEINRQWLFVR